MAQSEGKSYLASGNIACCVFVKLIVGVPADDFVVAQAGAGDVPWGVSFAGSWDSPGLAGSTAYAATTGQSLQVYHQGDVCLLLAGSAGYSAGDYLVPDANSAGVTATSGQKYGAKALQTTSAAAYGRVEVVVGTL